MDRTELLATMYQDEADEPAPPPVQPAVGANRTRKIRVGIIEYEVPTVEYMQHLEQLVSNQGRTIEQLQRTVNRFQATLVSTRNFLRRQHHSMQEMQADLDTKIGIVE